MEKGDLTPRMKVLADFAKNLKTVADIGCDHGKVAVSIAKKGVYVYAVDISEPSLQKAEKLAKEENADSRMEFHCDDGLESIKHAQLDGVIIAGMGWRTISSILDKNFDYVKKIKTLILQPMDSVVELRSYLCQRDFQILDEKLVIDDGRLYTIIVAGYSKMRRLSLRQMILGPKILENNDELLETLIKKELAKRHKKLAGLKKAKEENKKLIKQTTEEIDVLKEELGGNK